MPPEVLESDRATREGVHPRRTNAMSTNNTTTPGPVRRVFGELSTKVRRLVGLDDDPVRAETPDARTTSAEGIDSTTTAPTDPELQTDGGTHTRSELAAETGLAPKEYVLQLLRNRGGRVRQSEVGDLTGLSASTTSRLLSEMEDAGRITRVTLGREKVVCLPNHAPETPGQAGSTAAP